MTRTTLEKLGFKVGMTGWVLNRPDSLAAALPLPARTSAETPELIVAFVAARAELKPVLDAVMPRYRRGARLWLCYPKISGSIRADITRDSGWEPTEEAGLLAVSQVAVDADWSALRFRHRDEIPRLTRASEGP